MSTFFIQRATLKVADILSKESFRIVGVRLFGPFLGSLGSPSALAGVSFEKVTLVCEHKACPACVTRLLRQQEEYNAGNLGVPPNATSQEKVGRMGET